MTDEVVSAKRQILMDLLTAIVEDVKTGKPNAEVWKLHIDAALDRLDALQTS